MSNKIFFMIITYFVAFPNWTSVNIKAGIIDNTRYIFGEMIWCPYLKFNAAFIHSKSVTLETIQISILGTIL